MRARVVVLVALVTLSGAAACTSSKHPPTYHATMTVAPATARFDQPFTMALRGLPAGTTVEIDGSAVDSRGVTWTSKTSFRVPSNGVLTLDAPATTGSYTGVNTLGPLVTMTPPSGSSSTVFVAASSGARLSLSAVVDGTTVARAQTLRQNPYDAVVDTPLRPADGGLYGELDTPRTPSATAKPGVLVFGGSEGGDSMPSLTAAILAADGYPSLALAYFDEPGLPDGLHDIPLEYFERALTRLRAAPGVDPNHVAVFGVSRGGEAALLLGATYPDEINAVIAGVPSSQVYGSYPANGQPAWTLHGQPVEQGTPIAVEHIRGPILQACGTTDNVWGSCEYQQQITQRLQDNHFAFPVTTLSFDGAGHLSGTFLCCYSLLPPPAVGGTEAADGLAQVRGNAALQAFLAKL